MQSLEDYIRQFEAEGPPRDELAAHLNETRKQFDVHNGGDPVAAFEAFVALYNWLGARENKDRYQISQNLARNLPGALMQDWLIHLVISILEKYPNLDVFTEVRVPFGSYPLWHDGTVSTAHPSERSDLAVGYLLQGDDVIKPVEPWPRKVITTLARGTTIIPLVTINSKIRISQSEFFDWVGRESLMTKGNPHCLSLQVALRKEMDANIVDAAQASEKWFLLGTGGEVTVVPVRRELDRLLRTVREHLERRMGI